MITTKEDLKNLLPNYHKDVYEMQMLMDIENEMSDVAELNLIKVHESFYIQTAHEDLLRFYESFFGINIKVDDTLEERRFRVLTRIVSQPPFTLKYLEERLGTLGVGVEIIEHYQRYEVEIETSLSKKGQVEELPYMFKVMIPSNLVVISKNKLSISATAKVHLGHQSTYATMFEITNDFNVEYEPKGVMDSGATVNSWHEITTK